MLAIDSFNYCSTFNYCNGLFQPDGIHHDDHKDNEGVYFAINVWVHNVTLPMVHVFVY